MKFQILARLSLIVALSLIFYLAFSPGTDSPTLGWDKANHFMAFFMLTILSLVAFPRRSPLLIGLFLAWIGAMIELIQGLPVVHRDCDVWDWVVELIAIGAVYGVILAANLRRQESNTTP